MNRFDRQIKLIGEEAQQKLLDSHVVLIGVGGLGCVTASYLSAAGVGKLTLVDFDDVELSNLQRQIIYKESDVGKPKVLAAKRFLEDFSSGCEVVTVQEKLGLDNVQELVSGCSVVVDGTDNLRTRYILNDACYFNSVPLVYGSVFRYQGLVSVFNASPCYRCLFPEYAPAPSCSEAGVLGVVPGVVAMLQSTEVLKILTGQGESLSGRLLKYDALGATFSETKLVRDPECVICSGKIKSLGEFFMSSDVPVLTTEELKTRISNNEDFKLIDVREPSEWEEGYIEGAVLMPLGSLLEEVNKAGLGKDDDIVLYCKAGGRSERALLELREAGFSNLVHLEGGITAWNKA